MENTDRRFYNDLNEAGQRAVRFTFGGLRGRAWQTPKVGDRVESPSGRRGRVMVRDGYTHPAVYLVHWDGDASYGAQPYQATDLLVVEAA